ncbi:MAG: toll/interleukin-1 receptor domain-containing protein [Pseudomonadota bacterium]
MLQQDSSEAAASGGNIFVSYSWNDRDFTQQIIQLLKDEGYDPQVDRTDIAPSEAWRSRLSEMISSCDTLLFVLTDDWVTSDNCRSEFDEAVAAGKRLIPVVPRALTLLPDDAIAKLNYIYFFPLQPGDGRGFYEGMGDLKRALRFDLERLRLRRRYEDKANGWTAREDDLLTGDQLTQAETWMKREVALEGVPEQIAAYITASQDARARAEQRTKRNRAILSALGGFAIIASVIATGVAWFAYQSVNLAERDSTLLTEAARNWAEGRSSLVSNVREQDQSESERLLSNAEAALSNGLITIEKIDRESVKPIRVEIALDLASALLNTRQYEDAQAELSGVAEVLSEASEQTQATFHLASAFLACQADTGAGAQSARNVLEAAPETLRPLFTAVTLNTWRAPHPQCDGMGDALCVADDSCAVQFVEVTQPQTPRPTAPGRGSTTPPAPAPEPDPVLTDEEVVSEETREPQDAIITAPTPRPSPEDDSFLINDVYLHISDEAQRGDAQRLAEGLEALGYRVLGIELVPAPPGRNRSVRYYYDQQLAQADALREICADIASGIPNRNAWATADTYRVISLDGRYGGLPRNRVEIWL